MKQRVCVPSAMILLAATLAAAQTQPPEQPPAVVTPSSSLMQEPIGQVNGTVLNQTRKGVIGLPVAVIPQTGGVIHATSTDNGGRYAFKGLETGTYTVAVSLPARGILRKDGIRIRPLFRSIVDFTLATDTPAGTLPEVTAASKAADTGTASALTVRAMALGPDRSSISDALVTMTPVDGAGRFGRCRTGVDGICEPGELVEGTYRISAEAPGFITWAIGPLVIKGTGTIRLALTLVPFPMGFEGTLEDLIIPVEPTLPKP